MSDQVHARNAAFGSCLVQLEVIATTGRISEVKKCCGDL